MDEKMSGLCDQRQVGYYGWMLLISGDLSVPGCSAWALMTISPLFCLCDCSKTVFALVPYIHGCSLFLPKCRGLGVWEAAAAVIAGLQGPRMLLMFSLCGWFTRAALGTVHPEWAQPQGRAPLCPRGNWAVLPAQHRRRCKDTSPTAAAAPLPFLSLLMKRFQKKKKKTNPILACTIHQFYTSPLM